jgi:hypothetical protein
MVMVDRRVDLSNDRWYLRPHGRPRRMWRGGTLRLLGGAGAYLERQSCATRAGCKLDNGNRRAVDSALRLAQARR